MIYVLTWYTLLQDTSIAAFANGFIASVTAAPEFSSVVSVLATAIPVTAEDAIANDPEAFILNLLQGGSLPSWVTALPPSVGQYIESIGVEAAQQFTQELPGVYKSLSAEVAALETGAAAGGGFVVPTGGYGGGNYSYAGPSASASGGPGASPIPFVPGSAASSINSGGLITAIIVAGAGAGAILIL